MFGLRLFEVIVKQHIKPIHTKSFIRSDINSNCSFIEQHQYDRQYSRQSGDETETNIAAFTPCSIAYAARWLHFIRVCNSSSSSPTKGIYIISHRHAIAGDTRRQVVCVHLYTCVHVLTIEAARLRLQYLHVYNNSGLCRRWIYIEEWRSRQANQAKH